MTAILREACEKRMVELRCLAGAYDGFHPLARDILCFSTSLKMLSKGHTIEKHPEEFLETVEHEFGFVPEDYEVRQTCQDVHRFLEETFHRD